jgi:hypothetical protein
MIPAEIAFTNELLSTALAAMMPTVLAIELQKQVRR